MMSTSLKASFLAAIVIWAVSMNRLSGDLLSNTQRAFAILILSLQVYGITGVVHWITGSFKANGKNDFPAGLFYWFFNITTAFYALAQALSWFFQPGGWKLVSIVPIAIYCVGLKAAKMAVGKAPDVGEAAVNPPVGD